MPLRSGLRRNVRFGVQLLLLWGVSVICLEYTLVFIHSMPSVDLTTGITSASRVVSEDTQSSETGHAPPRINPRLMNNSEVARYMQGMSEQIQNSTLVSPDEKTRIRSKLHMAQTKLEDCVHRRWDLYACLESVYLPERADYLINKGLRKKAELIAGTPAPRVPPARNNRPPRPAPTDDPELEASFYQKGTELKYPYKHNVIVAPSTPCDTDTFMVVLVHSFHPYDDRRRAIRETWGGVVKGRQRWPATASGQGDTSNIQRHKLKFMFVLGLHSNNSYNERIKREASEHDDILQGDFKDAYVNMTLKSLLGLKYVSENCAKTTYMLKTDDDMFVNLPYLMDILVEARFNRSIMGPLNKGSKVYRTGKWKVTREVFPLYYYPPYESGAAYVITSDVVGELYDTAQYVTPFHVDDAYITGVLGKIIGVQHVTQPGFAYWTDKAPNVCDMILRKKLTGTKMTPKKLEQIWSDMKSPPPCRV